MTEDDTQYYYCLNVKSGVLSSPCSFQDLSVLLSQTNQASDLQVSTPTANYWIALTDFIHSHGALLFQKNQKRGFWSRLFKR